MDFKPPKSRKPRVELYDEELRPPRRRKPKPPPGAKSAANRKPARKKPKLPTSRGMSFSAKMVIAMFFAFVVVYMARGVYGFFLQDVDVMTLRLGNVERAESVPGMIIRYEEVFFADKDGRVVFAVNDFVRVSNGVAVASVMDVDAVSQIEQDMAQLNREIIGVHEMRPATRTDPHVERVNASLRNRVDRSAHNNMQMNMSEIYALLGTLTQITENRNNLITTESMDTRGDFGRRYDHLSDLHQLSSNDIYATKTGIMSPLIDGFETRSGFTPDTMTTLSREQVRMSADLDAMIPGREVSRGEGIFKIVGNTWYVATFMPHEMAQGFAQGDNRAIYLENAATGRFERVPMRIEHINYHHRDVFVVFRTTHNVIEFLDQRNVNIRVTDNVQRGFTVPSSAIATRRFFRLPLTHIHGIESFHVMHRRETGVELVPVDVNDKSETHAYILEDNFPLGIGDTIIPADAADLLHVISDVDVRIVRGVYRVYLNVARFQEVHIDGETLEAGTHVVIDPVRNPSLGQFHTIVTDASMVREGQVFR